MRRTRSFDFDDNDFIIDNHDGVIKIYILDKRNSYLVDFELTPERASLVASQLLRFAAEQED